MRKTIMRTMLSITVVFIAAGCVPPLPTAQVSRDVLVAEYNANAAAIPRLWSYATTSMTLYDENTGFPLLSASVDGLLLLKKGANPLGVHDFVLIGRETMAYELFRTGVSRTDGKYYMWQRIKNPSALWGYTKFAGAPGVKQLDINPLDILDVLAACELPSDPRTMPTVTMTMNTRPWEHAYVLSLIKRQNVSNRIDIRRKLYFVWAEDSQGNAKPRRLFRADFMNESGRRVMSAKIGRYMPVDVSNLEEPPSHAPIVPTDIEITWFNEREKKRATVRIKLSKMEIPFKVDDPDDPGPDIPAQARFLHALPPQITADGIIQADAHITQEGTSK